MSGSISQLQEHILEVDEHCRRTDECLDAWEIQDASEYAQELEHVHEAEGENDYEDDQTVITPDPEGHTYGLQSASSLGGTTSTGGASLLLASHDTGGAFGILPKTPRHLLPLWLHRVVFRIYLLLATYLSVNVFLCFPHPNPRLHRRVLRYRKTRNPLPTEQLKLNGMRTDSKSCSSSALAATRTSWLIASN